MKLTILGSGTCVPSLKRNAPGYFLEASGMSILIDCGSGTLHQLEKAGKSYKDIDSVFITHKHPDHFADLMPLIHALLATPDYTRDNALSIIGPEDFVAYYAKAIGPVLGRPRDFSINTITIGTELELGPLRILTAKTIHSANSLAYRFEHKGKSLVYTGDADYDQGIIGLAENADLLIADCSFPDSEKAKGHLSARECGMVAQKAEVNKLLLSHIYPSAMTDAERVQESREAFNGNIILAEDLMEIEI